MPLRPSAPLRTARAEACRARGFGGQGFAEPREQKEIIMTTLDQMRQGGTPFDAFLYAPLGEDRNGQTVSVLSALARLGLEPWEAASDLAGLNLAEARSRLDALLVRFGDVPVLAQDHAAIARRLVDLLPRPDTPAGRMGGLPPGTSGVLGAGFGLIALITVIRSLFSGFDGTGE